MGKTEKKQKENHATKVTKNQKTKIWDERNIRPQNQMTKICYDASNNCWIKFGKSGHSVASSSQGSLLVNTTVHWFLLQSTVTDPFLKSFYATRRNKCRCKTNNGVLLPKFSWPIVKKNVLTIEKNFWKLRLKAKTLQKFWDH